MFTFIGPFVILISLAARCMFLSGALEMFQEFFNATTDWEKLYDLMVIIFCYLKKYFKIFKGMENGYRTSYFCYRYWLWRFYYNWIIQ